MCMKIKGRSHDDDVEIEPPDPFRIRETIENVSQDGYLVPVDLRTKVIACYVCPNKLVT